MLSISNFKGWWGFIFSIYFSSNINNFINNINGNSSRSNREFFASDNPKMLETFQKNVALEEDNELTFMMNVVERKFETYEAGEYVMTDDKAPVELLGMKVVDELIRTEMAYYKKVFKEGGIKAVIENL